MVKQAVVSESRSALGEINSAAERRSMRLSSVKNVGHEIVRLHRKVTLKEKNYIPWNRVKGYVSDYQMQKQSYVWKQEH